jgi:hypothetical protein
MHSSKYKMDSRINGSISRVILLSLLRKLIRWSLDNSQHLKCWHGYGIFHVRLSTNFLLALDAWHIEHRESIGKEKKIYLPSYTCATLLCDEEEPLIHLFWSCPFASQCWDFICPQRRNNLSVIESFYDIRDKLKLHFAMEIIILAAWSIWIIKNNKILKNQRPSFQSSKAIFREEITSLSDRMKKKRAQSFK